MTFEFKKIIDAYFEAKSHKLDCVLATVVHLEGSSYRRPGVRMLIQSNGKMIGAVSGGCVEQEVKRQSDSVFETSISKVIKYDGRYRLGCEGVLTILIEPMRLDDSFLNIFRTFLEERQLFKINTSYMMEVGVNQILGSSIVLGGKIYPLSNRNANEHDVESVEVFSQILKPCFRLVIFGSEHDAVQLCQLGQIIGWEVIVVSDIKSSKTINDFPGASVFLTVENGAFDVSLIDSQTAIVLMSHNFAGDLKNLLSLIHSKPVYLGLLGPAKRRDQLLSQIFEFSTEAISHDSFFDRIHGPAGLNIGAETPQEIAISIISEILAVVHQQNPMCLSEKLGSIHA
ncbi:XdhC family protein [Tamlana sp. 2_MG-2023]|uniref:XdhC family protein n=1 Tax=unclassified Tamlana TaxID=2614803 RepID=UPI0026E49483|nr:MULTISPECIES: XdhC/CoxI family protein [unclassified Tamlana]MDO6761202.1 XdhC family protein [Tamlana sp. 2_MG-2023]MDO6791685.1 XdhC family protein [Tamlana sp. 1_MG-2023]